MKTLLLTKRNFIKYSKEYTDIVIVIIDSLEKIEKYKKPINLLITTFNKEYNWNEMFSIDDVYKRIKDNHTFYLLYYKNEEIGYVWTKEINNETCFAYNLYVTKTKNRPSDLSKCFLSDVYNYCLTKYKKIKMQIEDWNVAAFRVVYMLGVVEINEN